MAISVATARALIIAAPQPAPSAGYFRRVASVTANLSINVVGPRAIAIAVVLLRTISVTAIIGLLGTVLDLPIGARQFCSNGERHLLEISAWNVSCVSHPTVGVRCSP
jgi:hypothetical protein